MMTYSQEKLYNGSRKLKTFRSKFETGIEKLSAWNIMNLKMEFTVCILYRSEIVFKIFSSLYFTISILELSCKKEEKNEGREW